MGEQTNLGAGNQEPDPATAENPPSDVKAGAKKRDKTKGVSDAGLSQEKNIDPESPPTQTGDQGG
ncbi:MAG TPA: hypothetical protein VGL88_14775 [Pseudonocardiaceae bacterium]